MLQPLLLTTNEFPKEQLTKFETIIYCIPKMQPESKILRRPPHPKSAILNALIYKNLRSIRTLSELTRELFYHPAIAQNLWLL